MAKNFISDAEMEQLIKSGQVRPAQPAQGGPKEFLTDEEMLQMIGKSPAQPEVQQEEPKRNIFGKVANVLAPTATRTVEKLARGEGIGLRDVAGSALEIGSFLLPGGAAVKGATTAARVAKGLTLGRKAIQFGKVGAQAGALAGAGRSIGEGDDLSDIAKSTIGGATIGGVTGAALPIATRGATKALQTAKAPFVSRAAQKAEQEALLTAKAPDSRVATKKLLGGKVVTDKVAKEAVRQGIDEADVSLIKGGTSSDKSKMLKMLDIRERQLTNKRVTDRATDVVGDTFINNIAKPIENLNKEAGKKLDAVASRLAGKKADPSPAISQFAEDLDRFGIRVRKDGSLNFRNSAFEGLRGVQKDIINLWSRAMRLSKKGDALQMHRTKKFIDQIVEYGAEGEGLKGSSATMFKKFRHNLDSILDTNFSTYNKVNKQFSDTIQQLNNMAAVLGRKFRLGDTFADAQAGVSMRRILSNTQSRAQILKLLDGMQNVARQYGIKVDDDIITQANFADILEKMLGTEAPTSFLGQVSRGAETFGSTGAIQGAQQVGSAASEFARGNLVRGTIKVGAHVVDILRNVNQENRIKALRALLKSEGARKTTVFGRKVPK